MRLNELAWMAREIQLLTHELTSIRAAYRELEEIARPERTTYSKTATRQFGTKGRIVRKCRRCKKTRTIHGRGLCDSCYQRWYNANRRHKTQKLGSIPMTTKEWRKLRKTREGEWRNYKSVEKPKPR